VFILFFLFMCYHLMVNKVEYIKVADKTVTNHEAMKFR